MSGACETTKIADHLRGYFRHEQFRQGQERIVGAVLGGRDVLAVMPTGSGKSLGYQLPAVILPGTTIVVSPLISLMKDQVDELDRRGIPARALHSMLPSGGRQAAIRAARTGALRLLYVAPERFASDEFIGVLRQLQIARFVIDEAHCVSQWGHDFRPDYRRLRDAAALCRRSDGVAGRPPMAAFTATATPEVRDDIVALLGLDDPQVIVSGFDRPNIHLRVERVWDGDAKDELLPRLVRGRAGCLRGTILRYFGDAEARDGCDACGNCCPDALDGYERDLVRKVLSGIARAGERYDDRRIIAMLVGDTTDLPPALAGLSTTGLLRHESADALRDWIDTAITAGFIVRSADRYRTLGLTPRGREVMRGTVRDICVVRPKRLMSFAPEIPNPQSSIPDL